MTIAFDVSNDFTVFDWEAPIQYYVATSDSAYAAPVTVNYCLHREEHKTTVEGFLPADNIRQTTTWEIWSNNVAFIPHRKDKIVDSDSRTWIVESVDYCDKISRYRCHCYNPTQGKGV